MVRRYTLLALGALLLAGCGGHKESQQALPVYDYKTETEVVTESAIVTPVTAVIAPGVGRVSKFKSVRPLDDKAIISFEDGTFLEVRGVYSLEYGPSKLVDVEGTYTNTFVRVPGDTAWVQVRHESQSGDWGRSWYREYP